jgi:hypothetical protein
MDYVRFEPTTSAMEKVEHEEIEDLRREQKKQGWGYMMTRLLTILLVIK